jgi:hypothetical protein
MIDVAKCQKCNKELRMLCSEFNDKDLWIHLEIQRFYDMCDKCNNLKDLKYKLYFCTKECLKDYVANDLDKYIEDEVYWGRIFREIKANNAAIV